MKKERLSYKLVDETTYGFVVYPEWHPGHDDDHEAGDVDRHHKERQLSGESHLHP